MERLGIELTRNQLEAWADRALTDEEVEIIADGIPNSSIPDAMYTIANEAVPDELERRRTRALEWQNRR